MQSAWDLKKKLLDEHGELYRRFTTLILSMTTGAIGLLTTFRTSWVDTDDVYTGLAICALGLLLFSFFSGLVVQHRNMVRPLALAERINAFESEALEKGENDPVEIRKEPDLLERIAYKCQIGTFYVAVLTVVGYVFINISS